MVNAHALFVAHRDGVFRYLCRIVGASDAPDLTQEVFLRVSRGPVPEAPGEAQRAWVFRIARNLAINHYRDSGRRPATVELVDASQSPPQELAVEMREALDRLAATDRDVFLLREVAGLSYAEIALSCEMTEGAVRSRLHRARQQLREGLRPWLARGAVGPVRLYEQG